jgi:membrane protein
MKEWIEKIKQRILGSVLVRTAVIISKKIVLPGFDGQSAYDVSRFFFEAITRGSIPDRAAAISFKFLLAFFPAIIVLISLIPYIPVENLQETVMHTAKELMPQDAYGLIESTLENLLSKKYSTLISIGFIFVLYFASNTVQSILDGLNASYNLTQNQRPIQQRLVSLGLLIALPITMALALVIMGLSGFVIDYLRINDLFGNYLTYYGLELLKWLLSASLIFLSISTLYNVANVNKRQWKFISAGASLSTIGVIIVSLGFAYYVNNFGNYNKLYGSLGALLVTLMWIYINFMTILVGFELNTSISKAQRLGQELFNEKKKHDEKNGIV